MYQHVNPERGTPVATAPYNFIPVPQRVLWAEEREPPAWRVHDRYLDGAHSGWIDLEITTETPMFIRGPQLPEGGGWGEPAARLRPEPWATADGRPVIPGSSLRGMLRTLVEILAFAKLTPVSDGKPFYRSFGDDGVAKAYRDRVAPDGQKPHGGFLRRSEGRRWVIQPAGGVLRVSHPHLTNLGLEYQAHPNYHPPWTTGDGRRLQHAKCWVRPADGDQVEAITLDPPDDPQGWQPGVLVLTGSMKGKDAEFVLLDPPGSAHDDPVPVPEQLWRRFHDLDQLTQWQEQAFPKGEPPGGRRPHDGHLRDGEPVFYLLNQAVVDEHDNPRGLVFLGRARMFRLPYDFSPRDLLPAEHRTEGDGRVDLAEAIFGRVGPQGDAIKSRVAVQDCVGAGPADPAYWYEPVIEPETLAAPKPTTISHYLAQDGTKQRDERTTYLRVEQATDPDGKPTMIRGHKLYWHRWDGNLSQVGTPKPGRQPSSGISTVIQPVKAERTFTGRIRFDNLTDLELGALLGVLELPDVCRHKLGMARARYRSWNASGVLTDPAAAGRCRRAFEQRILQHARESGEPLMAGRPGLREIARLDALYLMLTWQGRPSPDDTRFLRLDPGEGVNDFQPRWVLPTPHYVIRDPDEPAWRGQAPVPIPQPPRRPRPGPQQLPRRDQRPYPA